MVRTLEIAMLRCGNSDVMIETKMSKITKGERLENRIGHALFYQGMGLCACKITIICKVTHFDVTSLFRDVAVQHYRPYISVIPS